MHRLHANVTLFLYKRPNHLPIWLPAGLQVIPGPNLHGYRMFAVQRMMASELERRKEVAGQEDDPRLSLR